MLPISIRFQAYIPQSMGKPLLSYFRNTQHFDSLINKEEFVRKIKTIDAEGFTWLPEPGNRFNHKYFATDKTDMFHHHEKERSARLSIHAKIHPYTIGCMSAMNKIFRHEYHEDPGGSNSQHSGLSHQVKAYIRRVPGTGTPSTGYHYEGVCSKKIEEGRADEDPLDIKINNSLSGTYFHRTGMPVSNDTSTIRVAASAGYPFIEVSPNMGAFQIVADNMKSSFSLPKATSHKL